MSAADDNLSEPKFKNGIDQESCIPLKTKRTKSKQMPLEATAGTEAQHERSTRINLNDGKSTKLDCEHERVVVANNKKTSKSLVVPNQKSKVATTSDGQKKTTKPRRRVATLAQRRAANIRERRRMFNLNAAFDRLRKKVPSFAYEKRLSRIETLKLAIMYIKFMDDLVTDDAYAEKYKQLTANATSAGFLASGSYLSLYGHCNVVSDEDEDEDAQEYPQATAKYLHPVQVEFERNKSQLMSTGAVEHSMIDRSISDQRAPGELEFRVATTDQQQIDGGSAARTVLLCESGKSQAKLVENGGPMSYVYGAIQPSQSLSPANFSSPQAALSSNSSPTLSSASSSIANSSSLSTTSPPAGCQELAPLSHNFRHSQSNHLRAEQQRSRNQQQYNNMSRLQAAVTYTGSCIAPIGYCDGTPATDTCDGRTGLFGWDDRYVEQSDTHLNRAAHHRDQAATKTYHRPSHSSSAHQIHRHPQFSGPDTDLIHQNYTLEAK